MTKHGNNDNPSDNPSSSSGGRGRGRGRGERGEGHEDSGSRGDGNGRGSSSSNGGRSSSGYGGGGRGEGRSGLPREFNGLGYDGHGSGGRGDSYESSGRGFGRDNNGRRGFGRWNNNDVAHCGGRSNNNGRGDSYESSGRGFGRDNKGRRGFGRWNNNDVAHCGGRSINNGRGGGRNNNNGSEGGQNNNGAFRNSIPRRGDGGSRKPYYGYRPPPMTTISSFIEAKFQSISSSHDDDLSSIYKDESSTVIQSIDNPSIGLDESYNDKRNTSTHNNLSTEVKRESKKIKSTMASMNASPTTGGGGGDDDNSDDNHNDDEDDSSVNEHDAIAGDDIDFDSSMNMSNVDDDIEKSTKTTSGTTGLRNLGNTCFMNAALQCLVHTTPLADFFLSKDCESMLSDEMLGRSFAELIENIYQSRYSTYKPDSFLREFTAVAPHFGDGEQRKCFTLLYWSCYALCFIILIPHIILLIHVSDDAHEFIRVLVDKLCEVTKDYTRCRNNNVGVIATEEDLECMQPLVKSIYYSQEHLSSNSSIITDVFCGQLISTSQCTVCNNATTKFEPFYDISLPIPEGNTDLQTLDDCIREFLKVELLDVDNMIECKNCRCKRVGIKRLQVSVLPNVLVLHLK
jgi:ubiquitin C-terminal hydrolase